MASKKGASSYPSSGSVTLTLSADLARQLLQVLTVAVGGEYEAKKTAAKPKATAKPKASPKATAKPKAAPKATAKPKAAPKAMAKPKAAAKPKATAKPKAESKAARK
ncbi:MAG TPA: hypothetical protein VEW48_23020 [Thermoanaerobaculia bacterium]|nr:hypothetical protein [Thermoanaerobaculia bacterium]